MRLEVAIGAIFLGYFAVLVTRTPVPDNSSRKRDQMDWMMDGIHPERFITDGKNHMAGVSPDNGVLSYIRTLVTSILPTYKKENAPDISARLHDSLYVGDSGSGYDPVNYDA